MLILLLANNPATNTNNTDNAISFPFSFSLYTSFAALLVFWFLLYATQNLAFIIQTALSWKLGSQTLVKIGSINFAFLGGKIFLHNIHYTDQNVAVKILAASIGFRWWLRKVNTPSLSEEENDIPSVQLPCRMSIHLAGVKVSFFCNSQRYELLKKSALKRCKNISDVIENILSHKGNSSDGSYEKTRESTSHVPEEVPLFYRMSPVTKIVIQDFVLEAGNPKFPESLKVTMKFCEGKHQLLKIFLPTHHKFSCETSLNIRNAAMYFQRNPDFNSSDSRFRNMISVKRPEDDDILLSALFGFRNFFKNKVLNGFKFDEQKENQSFAANSSIWFQKNFLTQADEPHSDLLPEHDQIQPEKESLEQIGESSILQCDRVEIEYNYDYCWRIRVGEPIDCSPQTDVVISFISPCSLNFGPWANSKKDVLVAHFFPFFFEDADVYCPNPGEIWPYISLTTKIVFNQGFHLDVPFRRHATSADPANSDLARNVLLQIHSPNKSFVQCVIPFLYVDENGGKMTISVEMDGCKVTPYDELELFNGQTLLETSRSFVVSCDFDYPLQWNGPRVWKYRIESTSPHVLLLKDHASFLNDLSSDWTSYYDGFQRLDQFIPVVYDVELTFIDSEWLFYEAEGNVVSSSETLSSVDAGTFFTITTPVLNFSLCAPFTSYKPTFADISFKLSFRHANCELSFPESHPLSELYKTKASRHFLYARQTEFSGKYCYFYRFHPENVDSLQMDIFLHDSSWNLDGHFLRYLLAFKNNYLGDAQCLILTSEFVANSFRNIKAKEKTRKLFSYDNEINQFETDIRINGEGTVLKLPHSFVNTDESKRILLKCFDFNAEMIGTLGYFDISVCTAPINVHIPSEERQSGSSFIQVQSLDYHWHISYGPLPTSYAFKSKDTIEIGQIFGQLIPQQIVQLQKSIQSITAQWVDSRDLSQFRALDLPWCVIPSDEEILFTLAQLRTSYRFQSMVINIVSTESLIRLSLEDGLCVTISNLISEKSCWKANISCPLLRLNFVQIPGDGECLAEVVTGFSLNVIDKRDDWERASRQQQDFLHSQRFGMESDDANKNTSWHQLNLHLHSQIDSNDFENEVSGLRIVSHHNSIIEEKSDPLFSSSNAVDSELPDKNSEDSLYSVESYELGHSQAVPTTSYYLNHANEPHVDYTGAQFKPFRNYFHLGRKGQMYDPFSDAIFHGSAKKAFSAILPQNLESLRMDTKPSYRLYDSDQEKEFQDQDIGLRKRFALVTGNLRDLLKCLITRNIEARCFDFSKIWLSSASLHRLESFLLSLFPSHLYLEDAIDEIQQHAREAFHTNEQTEYYEYRLTSTTVALNIQSLVTELLLDHYDTTSEYVLTIVNQRYSGLTFTCKIFQNLDFEVEEKTADEMDLILQITSCTISLDVCRSSLLRNQNKSLRYLTIALKKFHLNAALTSDKTSKKAQNSMKLVVETFGIESRPLSDAKIFSSMKEFLLLIERVFESFGAMRTARILWWITVLQEAVHYGCLSPRSLNSLASQFLAWQLFHGATDKPVNEGNIQHDFGPPLLDDSFNNYCYSDSLPFGLVLRKLLYAKSNRRRVLNPGKTLSGKLQLPEFNTLVQEFDSILDRSKLASENRIISQVLIGLCGFSCIVLEDCLRTQQNIFEFSMELFCYSFKLRLLHSDDSMAFTSSISVLSSRISWLQSFTEDLKLRGSECTSEVYVDSIRCTLLPVCDEYVEQLDIIFRTFAFETTAKKENADSSYTFLLAIEKGSFELSAPSRGSVIMYGKQFTFFVDSDFVESSGSLLIRASELGIEITKLETDSHRQVLLSAVNLADLLIHWMYLKSQTLKGIIHLENESVEVRLEDSLFGEEDLQLIADPFIENMECARRVFNQSTKSESQKMDLSRFPFGCLFLISKVKVSIAPTKGVSVIYELDRFCFSMQCMSPDEFNFNFIAGESRNPIHKVLFEAYSKVSNSNEVSGPELDKDLLLPQDLPAVYAHAQYSSQKNSFVDSKRETLSIHVIPPSRTEAKFHSLTQSMEKKRVTDSKVQCTVSLHGLVAFSSMANSINDGMLNRLLYLQSVLSSEITQMSNLFGRMFQKHKVMPKESVEVKSQQTSGFYRRFSFYFKFLFEGISLKCSTTMRRSPEFMIKTGRFQFGMGYVPSHYSSHRQVFESTVKVVKDSRTASNTSSPEKLSLDVNFQNVSVLVSSRSLQDEFAHVLNLRTTILFSSEMMGVLQSQSMNVVMKIKIMDTVVAVSPGVIKCILQIQSRYSSAFDKMKMAQENLSEEQQIDFSIAKEALGTLNVRDSLNQAKAKVFEHSKRAQSAVNLDLQLSKFIVLIGTNERVQDDQMITVLLSLDYSQLGGLVERKMGKGNSVRYESKASLSFHTSKICFVELRPQIFRTLDISPESYISQNEIRLKHLLLQCSLENGVRAVSIKGETQGPEMVFDSNVLDHAKYLLIISSLFEEKMPIYDEKATEVPSDLKANASSDIQKLDFSFDVNPGFCSIVKHHDEITEMDSSSFENILCLKLPTIRLAISHSKLQNEQSSFADVMVSLPPLKVTNKSLDYLSDLFTNLNILFRRSKLSQSSSSNYSSQATSKINSTMFMAFKLVVDATNFHVEIMSGSLAFSFLMSIDQQLSVVYTSGSFDYLEDDMEDTNNVILSSLSMTLPEVTVILKNNSQSIREPAIYLKLQGIVISRSNSFANYTVDISKPSQETIAAILEGAVFDVDTSQLALLKPVMDKISVRTKTAESVESANSTHGSTTLGSLNTLFSLGKLLVSINCNGISGIDGTINVQWRDLVHRSLFIYPGAYNTGILFHVTLTPSEISLIPSSSTHSLSANVKAGALSLRLYKIPTALILVPKVGINDGSQEKTRSSKIYDLGLDSLGVIVEGGTKRSLLLKFDAFPLRLKGGDRLELNRYASELFLGDQVLLKFSPHTITEFQSISRSFSDFINLISPQKVEEHQLKKKNKTSFNQGTFLISVSRVDVHLMKDENTKDFLSFIAIDVSLFLEQVFLTSRSSISQGVLHQEVIFDVGQHELEDGNVITGKKSLEGGIYIVHLQNEDQIVNVLMEVAGFFLRLKTVRVGRRVEAYFETLFDKDIEIPVKLGYYRWIADVLTSFIPSEFGSENKMSMDEVSVEVKEYVFKPKISLMGQLTPGRLVDSALAQLGLGTPRNDLPTILYKNLTIQLANMIEILQGMLEKL